MRVLKLTDEISDEINKFKKKEDLQFLRQPQHLIGFYFRNFYKFKLKATRLFVINAIYNNLEQLSQDFALDYKRYIPKIDVSKHFESIANTVYIASPDQSNIFYMMNQYLFLLDDAYDNLRMRILQEIESMMDQVNKLTQLYYNGNEKGRIVYVHLYKE